MTIILLFFTNLTCNIFILFVFLLYMLIVNFCRTNVFISSFPCLGLNFLRRGTAFIWLIRQAFNLLFYQLLILVAEQVIVLILLLILLKKQLIKWIFQQLVLPDWIIFVHDNFFFALLFAFC